MKNDSGRFFIFIFNSHFYENRKLIIIYNIDDKKIDKLLTRRKNKMEEKSLKEEVEELKLQVLELKLMVDLLQNNINPIKYYSINEENLKNFEMNQTEQQRELYYDTWKNQYLPSTQAFNPEYEAR